MGPFAPILDLKSIFTTPFFGNKCGNKIRFLLGVLKTKSGKFEAKKLSYAGVKQYRKYQRILTLLT